MIRPDHLSVTANTEGCPFFKLPFQCYYEGEETRRWKRLPFLFAVDGASAPWDSGAWRVGCFSIPPLMLGFFLLFCFVFWGTTGKELQFIRPQSEWPEVSRLLSNYPFCWESTRIPSSAYPAVPAFALLRSLILWVWAIPEQGIRQISLWQCVKGNAEQQHHGLCLCIFLI